MDKVSYALGLGIGRQLSQMGADNLNIDCFARAIKDVLAGSKLELDEREAQQTIWQRMPRKKASLPFPAACSIRFSKKETEKAPKPPTK